MNSSGQIAFSGQTNGPLSGVFLVSGGQVSNVAATGTAAPGVSSKFFQFNTAPAISDSGNVVFSATTTLPAGGTGPAGIWSGTPGALQLIAATGATAPGVAGATFASVSNSSPTINHAGQIAFRAEISDGSDGIWSNVGGSLTSVVREGAQAAGLPSGTTYTSFQPLTNGISPVLNNTGEIAFVAGLQGDGSTQSGVFAGKPGAIKPIVLENQSVPGLPSGDDITGFKALNLNDSGQMLFLANFSARFHPKTLRCSLTIRAPD